ncbi:MAG TPA: ABC transporter permease subunit, partial [Candidatus Aminicenantes bacterium]|nr:ABC transporter permease subunit [Candidatus Aminicenantes bacterium]
SLVLAGSATLLAVLFALPVALYLNLFAGRKSRLASWCRFSLDVLGGVPSIVFGAFGFLLMVAWGMRASLLGGTITVALMVFPTMARAMDEVLRIVPRELTEAAAALGATPLETALRVSVRQALPGLLTAILIAFGRGIGDAASVLFTAGFTDSLPGSLLRPVATLPLAIFFQLGSPLPEVQGRAYAAALVLTILILIVSLGSRLIGKRLTRHVIR